MAITEEMTRAIMVRMGATNTAEAINHPSGRATTAVRWATAVRMTVTHTVGNTDHLGGRRPMTKRPATTVVTENDQSSNSERSHDSSQNTVEGAGQLSGPQFGWPVWLATQTGDQAVDPETAAKIHWRL